MSYHCALKARRNFPLTISYSFCRSKSLVAMISSIWLYCLVKTPNTETPNTEGPTHRWVKTPKSHDTSHRPYFRQVTERMGCNVVLHPPPSILVGVSVSYPTRAVAQLLGERRAYDTSYPSLRRTIISYCCRVMSYWYIISLWYII